MLEVSKASIQSNNPAVIPTAGRLKTHSQLALDSVSFGNCPQEIEKLLTKPNTIEQPSLIKEGRFKKLCRRIQEFLKDVEGEYTYRHDDKHPHTPNSLF